MAPHHCLHGRLLALTSFFLLWLFALTATRVQSVLHAPTVASVCLSVSVTSVCCVQSSLQYAVYESKYRPAVETTAPAIFKIQTQDKRFRHTAKLPKCCIQH